MNTAVIGDEVYKSNVEQQVILLWDRVYEMWFAKVIFFTFFNCNLVVI